MAKQIQKKQVQVNKAILKPKVYTGGQPKPKINESNPYVDLEGNSRRRNTKQQRDATGQPMVSHEKGKSGTHPHDDTIIPPIPIGDDTPPTIGIEVDTTDKSQLKTPLDSPQAKQLTMTNDELIEQYKKQSTNYIRKLKDVEDGVYIIIGVKAHKIFRCIKLQRNKPNTTFYAANGVTYDDFKNMINEDLLL